MDVPRGPSVKIADGPEVDVQQLELDPVHTGDLMDVCQSVSRLVDRLRIEEFALRTENWTGLVVVYGMDAPEPRHRLRAALEKDGFTITVRRNEGSQ
jgi:hypothetical protein